MSNKEKNLILAVHIDSSELHLAAGFVENNKVNVLAIKRTEIQGIVKGSYQNKDSFESSFITAIKAFLNEDLNNYNSYSVKKYHLQTHTPDASGRQRLVVSRISFSSLVNEKMGGTLLQSNEVFKLLQNNFFNDNAPFEYGTNCFKCTADIAATNLFLSGTSQNETPEDDSSPYVININFGLNSTGLNFVTSKDAATVASRTLEFGLQYVVDCYNHAEVNLHYPDTIGFEMLYNTLKNYDFLPRKISPVKIQFAKRVYTSDQLIDIFVQKLQ